jgi:hypothetical protein
VNECVSVGVRAVGSMGTNSKQASPTTPPQTFVQPQQQMLKIGGYRIK